MSLRDQLIKSGAASKKQLKQAKHADRTGKKSKKNKKKEPAPVVTDEAALAAKERDRKLNAEINEARRKKQDEAAIQQILTQNKENMPGADLSYFFLSKGKFAEQILVTDSQQNQLATGELSIATAWESETEFVLLNKKNTLKLLEMAPELIACFHSEKEDKAPRASTDGESNENA